jgi:hypothetical protein
MANTTAFALTDIQIYLFNLLRVDVDVNGDGTITRAEVMTALSNRLVYSSGMTNLKLWCRFASVSADCFTDSVQLNDIYADAMLNFNSTQTFDGSGKS